MTDDTAPIAVEPIAAVASLVQQLDQALQQPGVPGQLGHLSTEFQYAIVAFRSRFRSYLPDAQQDLFSAPAAPGKSAP